MISHGLPINISQNASVPLITILKDLLLKGISIHVRNKERMLTIKSFNILTNVIQEN